MAWPQNEMSRPVSWAARPQRALNHGRSESIRAMYAIGASSTSAASRTIRSNRCSRGVSSSLRACRSASRSCSSASKGAGSMRQFYRGTGPLQMFMSKSEYLATKGFPASFSVRPIAASTRSRHSQRRPRWLIVRPCGVRLHAAEIHVGADEERLAIVAKLAVGGALARLQAAEQLAVRTEAIDASRAGCPDWPLLFDPQAVGQTGLAGLGGFRRVIELLALAERAVGLHRERLPNRHFGIGLGHIQCLLIGRETNAVGPRHFLGEQRDLAVLAKAIYAEP